MHACCAARRQGCCRGLAAAALEESSSAWPAGKEVPGAASHPARPRPLHAGYVGTRVPWDTGLWRLCAVAIGVGINLAASLLVFPVTGRRAVKLKVEVRHLQRLPPALASYLQLWPHVSLHPRPEWHALAHLAWAQLPAQQLQ